MPTHAGPCRPNAGEATMDQRTEARPEPAAKGECVTVQSIRLFGDPVLRTPAVSATTFDKELRTLVSDLTETLIEAAGAGLAAPQIGVGLRVFVYDVGGVMGHLVNPSLDLSEDEQDGDEG